MYTRNASCTNPALIRRTTCFLVLAAGAAAAQPSPSPTTTTTRPSDTGRMDTTRQTAQASTNAGTIMFVPAKKMFGADIYDSADKKIGEIEDLIADRGTGKVLSVVFDSKHTQGLKGNKYVVPYSNLGWNGAERRITVNVDPATIASMPMYTHDSWKALRTYKRGTTRTDNTALADELARQAALEEADPYARYFKSSPQTRTITGTVVSIDRRSGGPGAGEQAVITIKADDGQTRVVSLGPAYYAMGAPGAPTRDMPYTVDVIELPDASGDVCCVATRVMADGKPMNLRTAQGSPAWTDTSAGEASPNWADRFVLVSDLRGKPLYCRGERCGKVDEVIVECVGGRAALLSIDPDQNFLGMADTKRLVPWSVMTIGWDGRVNLDATKDMVLRSPKTPSDYKDLEAGSYRDVYSAYNVPAPTFRAQGESRAPGSTTR